MADLARVRVEWNGVVGGGVSTFYGLEANADSLYAAVGTFFNDIKGEFPTSIQWSFPDTGDVIASETGNLVGTWTASSPISPIDGQSFTNERVGGVGACVTWDTGFIVGTRRLRGRTFLTDLDTASYDGSGTLQATVLTTLRDAAATLAATNVLQIWSRPRGGLSGHGAVVSSSVRDRVSSLKSRRV